jgi:curved DNA-binding protein
MDDTARSKTKTHKDYYQILKVRPDATIEQIEKAYFHLAEKYGPDASFDAPDSEWLVRMFKDVSDAYEVLRDPEKRREYDKHFASNKQQAGDVRALWTKVTSFGSNTNQESTGKQTQIQALSLELVTEVTIKEAAKGTRRVFDISDPTPCEDCAGMKPVTRMQCSTCRGLGYFHVERKEEIELPPGLYDGLEIRKPELGRYDLRAGRYGDLVIKIKVKEHPYLSLSEKDVLCTVPVTLYEAILGAEIEVPTATGRVMMKVQPLTQSGRVYRLKGLGLAGADQLVTVEVIIPQSLSNDELALFKKLKNLYGEPNPREKRFGKYSR